MMQRGFSILADDICPIGPGNRIEPGMPRAKLWDETARNLSIDTTDLATIRDGDAKFNLSLGDKHCEEARSIHSFVWLVPDDVDTVQCSEMSGVEKFTVLHNNIYRPEFLPLLGLKASYLAQVAQVAAQCRVFKLVRPRTGFDINPLLDAITLLYEQGEAAPLAAVHPQ
jgi:hypothetical protein